jgi:hypothetical protein
MEGLCLSRCGKSSKLDKVVVDRQAWKRNGEQAKTHNKL